MSVTLIYTIIVIALRRIFRAESVYYRAGMIIKFNSITVLLRTMTTARR